MKTFEQFLKEEKYNNPDLVTSIDEVRKWGPIKNLIVTVNKDGGAYPTKKDVVELIAERWPNASKRIKLIGGGADLQVMIFPNSSSQHEEMQEVLIDAGIQYFEEP